MKSRSIYTCEQGIMYSCMHIHNHIQAANPCSLAPLGMPWNDPITQFDLKDFDSEKIIPLWYKNISTILTSQHISGPMPPADVAQIHTPILDANPETAVPFHSRRVGERAGDHLAAMANFENTDATQKFQGLSSIAGYVLLKYRNWICWWCIELGFGWKQLIHVSD